MDATIVVLAGGRSKRFGRDKLDATVGLLPTLIRAVSPRFAVVLVGPERDLGPVRDADARSAASATDDRRRWRTLTWVDDDEPGGGPAAGALTGIRTALSQQPDRAVVLLPGDAPAGAQAVGSLITPLSSGARAACAQVPGTDGDRLVPLPSALSPGGAAELLTRFAQGSGRSLWSMIATLDPVGVRLPDDALFDIDTPADLAAWRRRRGPDEPQAPSPRDPDRPTPLDE